jgi:hypothetical protein
MSGDLLDYTPKGRVMSVLGFGLLLLMINGEVAGEAR